MTSSHQPVALSPQTPITTLSDVMEAVFQLVGPDLARRGYRLILDLVDSTAYFEGDPAPVTHLIANILESASRYSRWMRGFVQLRVEDDHVVITMRDQDRDIGWFLVRRLADTHGRRISCCTDATERGTEVVVRFQVPVSEPQSDDSRVATHSIPARLLDRVTVARPLLNP